ALGPGHRLMEKELYPELLGVSCHELFHTWNVKAIRPADMRPYFYDGENYSRLHYVTEGVTTYYGDLMLMKGGVWTLEEWLRVFNNSVLNRHYANDGHLHISLEHASFDSWLVQYQPGVPNRKISFYTKGCLAAFILDYRIRKATENRNSLDTVMQEMYERFGITETGYTKEDYKSIAEKHAGHNLDEYFERFISGTDPMEMSLAAAADYYGLRFGERQIVKSLDRDYGFTLDEEVKVKQVWEGSPAMAAGLRPGDEIVALNDRRLTKGNRQQLAQYFEGRSGHVLHFFRNEELQRIEIARNPNWQRVLYMIGTLENPTDAQMRNREAWMQVMPIKQGS
ncbi:MAG: PDZ domain-containing protein, partial [Bacteroidota bacterium]